LSKLRKFSIVIAAAGSILAIICKLVALGLIMELRTRVKFWRYRSAFRKELKKYDLPKDLANELSKEYRKYLNRWMREVRISNLLKYITKISKHT